MTARRQWAGFSLVELLVSAALTGILLVGVATIFVGWRSGSAATERMSQLQNRGRHALDELSMAIRSAGFAGCSRAPMQANAVTSEHGGDHQPLRAYAATPGQGLTALPGSDVLVVQAPKRAAAPVSLEQPMRSANDVLRISGGGSSGIEPGDLVLIHSCEARAFFTATSVHEGVISHDATGSADRAASSLGYAFDAGAELLPLETTSYYVGTGLSGDGSSSLFRRRGDAPAEEIVAGIDSMQLLFGVDADRDDVIDGYRPTQEVTDWDTVLSVSLTLVVRATDPAARRQPSANERAHAQETFSAVVGLRNRYRTG